MSNEIVVRQLRETDLVEADRVVRVAFGTFFGLPDPINFMGDAGICSIALANGSQGGLCGGCRRKAGGFEFRRKLGQFRIFWAVDDRAGVLGSRNSQATDGSDDGMLSTGGARNMPAFSLSRTARSTSDSIRSSASGRGF